jgi:hypothetical protein
LTVEIEVQALASKPLGQLAPQNVADLCALEERPDLCTNNVRLKLKGFRDRMCRTFADLPVGGPWRDEIEAFAALDPAQVPGPLRTAFAEQLAHVKRPESDKAVLRPVLDQWATVEPAPFVLAAPTLRAPKVTKVPEREPAETRGPRPARDLQEASFTPPKHRPVPVVDAARLAWIERTVLERLRATDGLLEDVLLTVVKHRARERYADLQPHEIRDVLRALERTKRAVHSAGRWKAR